MKFYTAFAILLLNLSSCKSEIDFNYIKSTTWIYDKEFKIGKGDVASFEKSQQNLFILKRDTIFYNGNQKH